MLRGESVCTPRLARAGEALRSDLDVSTAMDTLYGPIRYRLLLRHAPLDDAFARSVVDHPWPSPRRPARRK